MSWAHGGGTSCASVTLAYWGGRRSVWLTMASMNQVARVGQGPTGSRPLFESPAQIVGAALGSAAVVGFLLAHSVQYGVAVLVALLFLPIALLNLPLAIGLFVPLIYLEQVPGAARIPSGVALLIFMAWLGTLAGREASSPRSLSAIGGCTCCCSCSWPGSPCRCCGPGIRGRRGRPLAVVLGGGHRARDPHGTWTRRHRGRLCRIRRRRADRRDDHPAADLLGIVDGLRTRLGGDLINPNYFAAAS